MSTAIGLHLGCAAIALVLGAALPLAPKGTPRHRVCGRRWIALTGVVVVPSVWIPSFLRIGWIHVFALLGATGVPRAILATRRGDVRAPRRPTRR